MPCPSCDDQLNCVWNQTCSAGNICMIRSYDGYPFTTHCIDVRIQYVSSNQNTYFIKITAQFTLCVLKYDYKLEPMKLAFKNAKEIQLIY